MSLKKEHTMLELQEKYTVKPNICGTNYFVENRQVFLLEISYLETFKIFGLSSMVKFKQESIFSQALVLINISVLSTLSLFRVGFKKDSCLFSVCFRPVLLYNNSLLFSLTLK